MRQRPTPTYDRRYGDRPAVTIVIPTYNEVDTLPIIVDHLLALKVPELTILVVDDASPDGTGALADGLTRRYPGRVQVLHRPGKSGIGRAYVAGMSRALDAGAEVVIQMDADLSHPVSAIPVMLDVLSASDAAVVVGSRYVAGGSVAADWPRRRRLLSSAANRYVNAVLHLGIRDATSGFKAWRAQTLRALDLESVCSDGYSFQVETAHRTARLGLPIREVPIHFEERTAGVSKMSLRVQVESAVMPWRLRRREAPLPLPVPYERHLLGVSTRPS